MHTHSHTHPSKDEPSLSSPDDFLLYLDLRYDPQNIRDFYTVMKDRLDHFKITPKRGTKKDFVKIDEDKFISELDAQLDIIQEKRSESMANEDYQDDLQFCEQVTKDAVAWLNKSMENTSQSNIDAITGSERTQIKTKVLICT